jgi:UDPglucose 6-dehydrogenase
MSKHAASFAAASEFQTTSTTPVASRSPFNIVGIMALGMVGGAIFRYFEKRRGLIAGQNLIGYDPFKPGHENLAPLQKAEVIFVAVPTPYLKGENGKVGFDLSFVRTAISSIEGSKVVVIKSTVLPGATDQLQLEFPQHKMLFNPEFLTELTADHDMLYPDRQLVGYTAQSAEYAAEVMELLPHAPYRKLMPAREAETVKYFGNTLYAVKVAFANQIYDICQAMGVDYEMVKDAAAADPRIGPSHLEIFHKGYRGYGGKCLPKDIRALIELGETLGVEMTLLKRVEEINNILVGGVDKT